VGSIGEARAFLLPIVGVGIEVGTGTCGPFTVELGIEVGTGTCGPFTVEGIPTGILPLAVGDLYSSLRGVFFVVLVVYDIMV